MTEELVVQLAGSAIKTAFLIAAPALLVGVIVGVSISLFQAVTSIQDPTLSFIPKVFAVMLVILLTFPWMMNVLRDFTLSLLTNIDQFIR